jgi:hypothetical protein
VAITERPIVVSAPELRAMFNQGRYWEQAEAGELYWRIAADRHPAAPLANEPFCTQSQYIHYTDQRGEKVAEVHQYKRPDGSIGLSGRPDPKKLWVGGVLYAVAADD